MLGPVTWPISKPTGPALVITWSPGVPCQPYSDAGARKGLDCSDGRLYQHVIKIARLSGALGLMLENVKGMVHWNNGAALALILADVTAAGFVPEYRVLNCADYGIPQLRKRLIIVAFRDGLGPFRWPSKRPPVTVRQALNLTGPYSFGYLPQVKTTRNAQGERILNVDRPAFTIMAKNCQEWIQPLGEAPRRLTLAQAAAIQTFPPFDWQGPLLAQHKQVGNAVPPMLGYLLGQSFAERWGHHVG